MTLTILHTCIKSSHPNFEVIVNVNTLQSNAISPSSSIYRYMYSISPWINIKSEECIYGTSHLVSSVQSVYMYLSIKIKGWGALWYHHCLYYMYI